MKVGLIKQLIEIVDQKYTCLKIPKLSVASTTNMSECLKQFIFIMDMRRIFETLNIVTIESMGP